MQIRCFRFPATLRDQQFLVCAITCQLESGVVAPGAWVAYVAYSACVDHRDTNPFNNSFQDQKSCSESFNDIVSSPRYYSLVVQTLQKQKPKIKRKTDNQSHKKIGSEGFEPLPPAGQDIRRAWASTYPRTAHDNVSVRAAGIAPCSSPQPTDGQRCVFCFTTECVW